jgi:tetratricopeptide (TPR) repeat protein
MSRTRTLLLGIALAIAIPLVSAPAQTAAALIQLGDQEHAAGRGAAALARYEAAVALDSANYAALWRAAREGVNLGEAGANEAERTARFEKAVRHARRAVAISPRDAEGHFQLARAVGKHAMTMGTRDRIKFAGEVREQALATLAIDPRHAGAKHVMGVWNAEIMRLNAVSRTLARTLLGGAVFGEANWADAQRYLEEAVSLEPARITHRLDLAQVLVDREQTQKAREQYEWIAKAPAIDANDQRYKQDAARALARIRTP